MIATAFQAIERFLLPNACIACDALVSPSDPDTLICGVCVSRMRSVGPGCARCAQPLPPVGPCRFCATWVPQLSRVSSAVWLGPEARVLVHQLKYAHGKRLADVAASVMARRLRRPEEGLLVPIPVAPGRVRRRGYNQAALMAEGLREIWNLPMAEQALVRLREAGSQTALTPEARLANVAGAFGAIAPNAVAQRSTDSPEPTVLLVDDVLTTGATLDAAARALVRAGWRSVVGLTFARALTYGARLEPIEVMMREELNTPTLRGMNADSNWH